MKKKNLIVAICGDESMHKFWMDKQKDFDLFVVYYGDDDEKYKKDGIHYERAKGTKFVIMDQICQKYDDFLKQYDAILIPDDDLYITGGDRNRFFGLFHKYEMKIAAPSIMGWQLMIMSAHNPQYILRYTNWVEIMTPCFDQSTFQAVRHTFTENDTNWGIEYLWTKILGTPKTSIGIIDDVVALHTRPCFYGDTYQRNNNNFEKALDEICKLSAKHGVDLLDHEQYGGVKRELEDYNNNGSEAKFFPANCEILKELVTSVRKKRCKTFL